MGAPSEALPRTPVCGACGVVAPVRGTQCGSCGKALPQPRVFAPPPAGAYWVALRCTFKCRACGFPSPLDGVVAGEQLDCAQCGSLQRFDPSAWSDGLGFARAVGDLGGPHPEGRTPSPDVWIGDDNPHAAVGVTATFASRHDDRLSVDACPGYPVCVRCAAPLECALDAGGTGVATRCSGCGATARYGPATVAGATSNHVLGVVSEEQRIGRVDVRVEAGAAGAASLVCPQCGAGLHETGGPLVECAYCRTTAFIPPRARPRASGKLVAPSVFWIAFSGPSPERLALEAPRKATADLKKAAAGLLTRGLAPLPGIELADRAPGIDVRQWAVTLGLTALSLGAGYLILWAVDALT